MVCRQARLVFLLFQTQVDSDFTPKILAWKLDPHGYRSESKARTTVLEMVGTTNWYDGFALSAEAVINSLHARLVSSDVRARTSL